MINKYPLLLALALIAFVIPNIAYLDNAWPTCTNKEHAYLVAYPSYFSANAHCNDFDNFKSLEENNWSLSVGKKGINSFDKFYDVVSAYEESIEPFSIKINGKQATKITLANERTMVFVDHINFSGLDTADFEQFYSSFRFLDKELFFEDVHNYQAIITPITLLHEKGVISGYPDGTYKPQNPINRAEFTKIVMGAIGEKPEQLCDWDEYPVTDVEQGSWYEPFVNRALCSFVVGGYPDGTFKPANNINFAEAAKIVVSAFETTSALLQSPQSDTTTEPWHAKYVKILSDANAIPTTVESLEHLVTRGEMAEIIYRVMEGITDLPSSDEL